MARRRPRGPARPRARRSSERPDPTRFRTLPEPVRTEDAAESGDVETHPYERDDYWREVEWMLRTSGGV